MSKSPAVSSLVSEIRLKGRTAPVVVGLIFGATQLRELAREGEDLVRSRVEITRNTRDLLRHLASMERTANL